MLPFEASRALQDAASCTLSGREARMSRRSSCAESEEEGSFKLGGVDLDETAMRLRTVALQLVSAVLNLLLDSGSSVLHTTGNEPQIPGAAPSLYEGVSVSRDPPASPESALPISRTAALPAAVAVPNPSLALPLPLVATAGRLGLLADGMEEGLESRLDPNRNAPLIFSYRSHAIGCGGLSLGAMIKQEAHKLQADLKRGVSVSLLSASLRLLEQLSERASEARHCVCQLARCVLTTYRWQIGK